MNNLSGLSSQRAKELGVSFHYGISEKLWEYTQICEEEFDLIHEAFGAPKDSLGQSWSKVLDVSIGKGVQYVLGYREEDDYFEIRLESPNEFFGAPLTVTVAHFREPGDYDHNDWCAYSAGGPFWEEDENGEEYILGEDGDRLYPDEVECHCDPVEVERKVFVLGLNNDDIKLDEPVKFYESLA